MKRNEMIDLLKDKLLELYMVDYSTEDRAKFLLETIEKFNEWEPEDTPSTIRKSQTVEKETINIGDKVKITDLGIYEKEDGLYIGAVGIVCVIAGRDAGLCYDVSLPLCKSGPLSFFKNEIELLDETKESNPPCNSCAANGKPNCGNPHCYTNEDKDD